MSILPKGSRSGVGVDSFQDLDSAVLEGFVAAGEHLTLGQRKIAAGRMRARVTAVEYWMSVGERPAHKHLAGRLGVSERCLSYQFPKQVELYAFPPPELARSLVGASKPSLSFKEIALLVRPVFDALGTNVLGCALMSGLVTLHRAEPDLGENDAYFATAMRAAIRSHRPRRTLAIANLFTGGVRMAFEDWVDEGTPDMSFVADRVASFLVGPVQNAYTALIAQPSATGDLAGPVQIQVDQRDQDAVPFRGS